MKRKKVFVSGCYDMLHSGHVAFFEEAAHYGDLYVGIGSDKTIFELKARKTINSDNERLYMVSALKTVKEAWINKGSGILDFEADLEELKPDIFFVNRDGHSVIKEELCKKMGIEYIISERIPHGNLPSRSTTALRTECRIPYRIDLAGGWLDQVYVNKLHPGAVLTICIEPDYEFNDRSGMSTSSRKKAIELWQTDIPEGDKEKIAKTLFCFENPPGTAYISGSQDALGITMPGLNRFYYDNAYWPVQIENILKPDVLSWIEKHIWLIPLYPRHKEYDVLSGTNINKEGTEELAKAADDCWLALINMDAEAVGQAMINSLKAQTKMFPNMITEDIIRQIDNYKDLALGYKISGAGGGGYLILFSENPINNAIQIRIRR
ncbi:adenylyltransferase/cytidyltransferase family protein [Bacteroides sp. 51]|uniref:adenylyltransferase/cytidyltransferase family protein n=1 Tax=Bacteroides sp. 51 TaxID=2302938 RepID=UPI0013D68BF6|nr:adenylyltransferase/cytidyltransferase family protein [Bacteroides sp. 51]NDV81529.1 cytidyltransferase [Bacteroides sp. 51]